VTNPTLSTKPADASLINVLIGCSFPVYGQKHGEENQLGARKLAGEILEQQRANGNATLVRFRDRNGTGTTEYTPFYAELAAALE
jgi:hypothetical protein